MIKIDHCAHRELQGQDQVVATQKATRLKEDLCLVLLFGFISEGKLQQQNKIVQHLFSAENSVFFSFPYNPYAHTAMQTLYQKASATTEVQSSF